MKFTVNSKTATCLTKDGKSKVLKENETHDTKDFDVNAVIHLATNGKSNFKKGKNGKPVEEVVYRSSVSLEGTVEDLLKEKKA